MTVRTPRYLPRRLSSYVPQMAYSANVVHGAPHEVNFGPMAVAAAANILSAASLAVALTVTTFLQDNTDPIVAASQAEFPAGPGFGRCLQAVASGASTATLTIKGRDFLGQPMTEIITLNGATPVLGVKAFKWIDSITNTVTAATTVNVGTSSKLGLPYRMSNVLAEMLDGVRVATLGTLVTPSLVDPQTAITTDPSGTYAPQSTLTGTAYLSGVFLPNGKLNAAGNGGLHGLAHFAG